MWYGISSLRPFEQYALFGVLGIAIAGLLYALFLRRQVMREDAGTAKMPIINTTTNNSMRVKP